MSDLAMFLTSQEIVCVYIIGAVACVIYFVFCVIDRYSEKRKRRHNTKELNRLVEEVNTIVEQENEEKGIISKEGEYTYVEPVMVIDTEEKKEEPEIIASAPVLDSKETTVTQLELNIDNIEELEYTEVAPTQTEAQIELKKLTEELEKASNSDLNIDLTAYEEIQEKEAIISLEELLKRSKEIMSNNEVEQYADEGNEPISLKDLEIKLQKEIEEEVEKEEQIEVIESVSLKPVYQAFQSIPVISPIYGLEKKTNDIELENTANYEKLDEEIRKTNEFIMTLKELQKHLE